MRYRKLSPTGDYMFGSGEGDYLRNSPETVAQACVSRLRLLRGEWFMDESAGTPWDTQVLGAHTGSTRDMTVFGAVLGTEGVLRITDFVSRFDPNLRTYSVRMTVDTVYGQASVAADI